MKKILERYKLIYERLPSWK